MDQIQNRQSVTLKSLLENKAYMEALETLKRAQINNRKFTL